MSSVNNNRPSLNPNLNQTNLNKANTQANKVSNSAIPDLPSLAKTINDEIQLKDRFVPLIQAHLIDDKIMQMIDNLNELQENESSKVYWYTWR